MYILKTNTFHVTKKLLPLLGGNIHCINQRIQDLMALLSHLQYSGGKMPPKNMEREKRKEEKGKTRKREKGKQTIRQLETLVLGSTLQKIIKIK